MGLDFFLSLGQSNLGEAVLLGDGLVIYSAQRQDDGADDTCSILARGAVDEERGGIRRCEVVEHGSHGSSAGLPDGPIGVNKAIGALLRVLYETQGDSLGAIVLVLEDGDENTACAVPLPDPGGVALNLYGRAEVIDVGDAQGLQRGDAGIGDARGFGGAEDDAGLDGVAGPGGDGRIADIAEVGQAGNVDERGAEVRHCYQVGEP